MRQNPRLALPYDPDQDIWSYYNIMRVSPIIMDDFLLLILTVPLVDQSLQMDLYKFTIYLLYILSSTSNSHTNWRVSIWLLESMDFMQLCHLKMILGYA